MDAPHPEWQGSVPCKFGARGLKRVECEARDGSWGIAKRGLGGYMTDVEGKRYEDTLQCKRPHPNGSRHGQDVAWRPSRRCCPAPVPMEPDQMTKWPPWIPPKGTWVPRQAPNMDDKFDMKVDPFSHTFVQRLRRRKREKESLENLQGKKLVQGLDVWEAELRRRRILSKFTGSIPTKQMAIGQPETPSVQSLRGSVSEPMLSRVTTRELGH